MNTIITLDPQGETKQLHENIEFKEKFERKEDNSIINKNNQKPFSGVLTINYNSDETFAIYNFIEGKQEGKQKNFYKNGKIRSELNLKNGKYNGAFKQYYENGKEKMIAIYNDGAKIESKNFYLNGAIMDQMFFKNGKEEGKGIMYFETGDIKSTFNYKQGLLNGVLTEYHENKNIKSEGKIIQTNILNEYKEGLWKYYYENGNKKEEGKWGMGGRHGKDNIKKGIWKYYNNEGKLESTKEYDNMGKQIKEQKYGK